MVSSRYQTALFRFAPDRNGFFVLRDNSSIDEKAHSMPLFPTVLDCPALKGTRLKDAVNHEQQNLIWLPKPLNAGTSVGEPVCARAQAHHAPSEREPQRGSGSRAQGYGAREGKVLPGEISIQIRRKRSLGAVEAPRIGKGIDPRP